MNDFNSNLLPEILTLNNFQKVENDISRKEIKKDLNTLFNRMCPELVKMNVAFSRKDFNAIAALIYGDLYARVEQDPIALTPSFIYKLSRSFKVIFYYRLAHALFNFKHEDEEIEKLCKFYAFFISEEATKATTIEIHPQAKIGKNFVIDHGVKTLIGATSVIGDNCTILNNVLLGARKITNNNTGKRHPTIGDNVHVARGVQILGPVHIGNHSKIGPDCVIVNDVSEKSIVKRIVTQQISIQKK